jgi:hypothetical protein
MKEVCSLLQCRYQLVCTSAKCLFYFPIVLSIREYKILTLNNFWFQIMIFLYRAQASYLFLCVVMSSSVQLGTNSVWCNPDDDGMAICHLTGEHCCFHLHSAYAEECCDNCRKRVWDHVYLRYQDTCESNDVFSWHYGGMKNDCCVLRL